MPAATDGEAGLAGFRDRDAASGRAWGSPTALTAPRGKVQLGYWGVPSEVGFATVGYGVTDRLQIAAGVGWDHSVSYDCFDCTYQQRTTAATLSAKYQVARRAHTAVALQASWLTVDDTALSTWSLVATHCLDGDACKVVGSAHLSFLIEADAYDSYGNVATAVHGVVGGSLIAGNRLKAVLDVGVVGADENDRFTLAYGGVRWAGRRLAGDLGFLTAIQDGDTETAPVPLLSVSGRL
ncbi:MAG: hypothetical protein H6709_11755 [Kofleriaceae bacterium]|nr:hypothetical protein [Kofleriaceae bacterium]